MKRKILIVDDEELARRRLRTFLEREAGTRGEDFVIEEAPDAFVALEKIDAFDPDLVFLDVQMPEMNGFEMLRLCPGLRAKVIFQTAHDAFAIRAFEVNACDYLLKPSPDARLRASLDRAFRDSPGERERLEKLLADGPPRTQSTERIRRFVLRVGLRHKVIEESEVEYFLSEDHVTRLFTRATNYVVDFSLNELQTRLDPTAYVRIHRNCLVKLEAVRACGQGPGPTVTLRDGTELQASREGGRALRRALNAEDA
mgnify:CR=1 FL=1